MDIKQTIRRYVLSEFILTDDELALHDGDSFIAQGIVDSTGVLEILLFIESTFGIKVSHHEIIPENFDSVDRLVAFVQHKQASLT